MLKSTSTSAVKCFVILIVSVAVGFISRLILKPPPVHGRELAAFTVEQVEERLPNVNAKPTSVMKVAFARRGDGSWFHSYPVQGQDGKTRELVEFADLGALISVHTEPVTKSAMSRHLKAVDLRSEISSSFEACDGSEKSPGAEHGELFGLETVHISKKLGSAGIDDKWVAPLLDCYPLRSVYTAQDGRQIKVAATNLSIGEPVGDLFRIPSGYVERSPREIDALYAKSIPGSKYLPEEQLERLEARYQARQNR